MPNRLTKGNALFGKLTVSGDVTFPTGSIGSAEVAETVTTLSAGGTAVQGINILNNSTADAAVVATIPTPVAGRRFVVTTTSYSTAGADAVKWKLASGTFVGQTGGVAVMNAAADLLDVVGISGTQYLILNNVGTVTFSTST